MSLKLKDVTEETMYSEMVRNIAAYGSQIEMKLLGPFTNIRG